MTILCLTGWQQPSDALSNIAPDAVHFDYGAYDDVNAMFAALPKTPRLAIGWSLGGQLLVRAVAGGHVRPDVLLLLGAPFQWVADSHFKAGMPAAAANGTKGNYERDPEGMLKSLNALVAMGDKHQRAIVRTLNASLRLWPNGMFWLNELVKASCARLDFSAFPHTLVIHGLEDKVIRYNNAQALVSHLPQAQSLLWPECAHAPHLHDPETLAEIVREYV